LWWCENGWARECSRGGAEGHRVERSDIGIKPDARADVNHRCGSLCECAEAKAGSGAADAAGAALQSPNGRCLCDVGQAIHLLPVVAIG
jgi:hypothetical protein